VPFAWTQQLEPLELVSRNAPARELLLRVASIAEAGGLEGFLAALARDEGIDAATRAALEDVSRNRPFLRALQDYVRATRVLH
jgi:hypothetical protein